MTKQPDDVAKEIAKHIRVTLRALARKKTELQPELKKLADEAKDLEDLLKTLLAR
ncbi:hypothetical protein ACFLS9_09160 [Bacteroidota bacterium]